MHLVALSVSVNAVGFCCRLQASTIPMTTDQQSSASQPPRPLGLLAELTHRCPQRCVYCSNPLELVRKNAELTTEQWAQVFEQAADLGVIHVHLSGGEPTVRQDLNELVEAARQAGLYTNLITSGTLLDEAQVHRFAEIGLDHVQLSIEDSDAELADHIGGFDGAHLRKMAAAAWIGDAGLRLTINAVVHRQNLHHLEEMIQLAVSVGADRMEVAHAQYQGWALKNRDALLPTRDQLDEATRLVEQYRQRLDGTMAIDYVVPDYHAVRPKACMGGWGRQFLAVSPDGRVLPCHGADSIPELTFDNVRDRCLDEIWFDGEAFERFRGVDWMPEPCKSCPEKTKDWGGCRCQAFALTGDAANTDPVCALSPQHDLVEQAVEEATTTDEPTWQYRGFGDGGDVVQVDGSIASDDG